MTIKLKNWGASIPSPYKAPEIIQGCCLTGEADGHPVLDLSQDNKVLTSLVERGPGRIFTTRSGNTYELVGEPAEEWVRLMDRAGYEVDLNNPLILKDK